MKKILIIVLALVMVVSFASCKSSKKTNQEFSKYLSSSEKVINKEENTKNLFDNNEEIWEATMEGVNIETYKFTEPKEFNLIRFEEVGKGVDNVLVEAFINNEYVNVYEQDEMGTRTGVIDTITTNEVRVSITSAKKDAKIKNISFEMGNPIKRDKEFRVASYLRGPFTDELVKGFDGRLTTTTDIILFTYKNFDLEGNLVGKTDEEIGKDIKILKDSCKKLKIDPTLFLCVGTYVGDKEKRELLFNNPESRANFVSQCVKLVKDFDLDGIDIDYEYPETTKEWNGYNSIVIELKAALGDKQLSIALPPWGVKFSAEAIACIDQVQIMNYDLFDEKRRHTPYATFPSSIEYFTRIGFNLQQLNPGIALYGREKEKDVTERWLTYGGVLDKYPDIINKNTNEIDGSYFSGKTINRDKTYIALEKGCGGIMAFRYACDAPYDNQLSIYRGVNEILTEFIAK